MHGQETHTKPTEKPNSWLGTAFALLGIAFSLPSIIALTLKSAAYTLKTPWGDLIEVYEAVLPYVLIMVTGPIELIVKILQAPFNPGWDLPDDYENLLPIPLLYFSRSVIPFIRTTIKKITQLNCIQTSTKHEHDKPSFWLAASLWRFSAAIISLLPILLISTDDNILSNDYITKIGMMLTVLISLLIYAILNGFGNALLLPGLEKHDFEHDEKKTKCLGTSQYSFYQSICGHTKAGLIRAFWVGSFSLITISLFHLVNFPAGQAAIAMYLVIMFHAGFMLHSEKGISSACRIFRKPKNVMPAMLTSFNNPKTLLPMSILSAIACAALLCAVFLHYRFF